MAKAFSELEKKEIKKQLMETALELFHSKGTKAISIATLTSKTGIAQGSFYAFWKNKEAIIIDIMTYRSKQKLDLLEHTFDKSLADPKAYLINIINTGFIDLLEKLKNKPVYKDAFQIFLDPKINKTYNIEHLYGDFLDKLICYWNTHSAVTKVNKKGLANGFIGSFILCANYFHFEEETYQEILKIYISGVVDKYIEI